MAYFFLGHPVHQHTQPFLTRLEACFLFNLLAVKQENICTVDEAIERDKPTAEVPTKFSDLFDGYGLLGGEMHLDLDCNVTPVQLPLRKLPACANQRKSGSPTATLARRKNYCTYEKVHGSQRFSLSPRPTVTSTYASILSRWIKHYFATTIQCLQSMTCYIT